MRYNSQVALALEVMAAKENTKRFIISKKFVWKYWVYDLKVLNWNLLYTHQ